jgi:hypothetical protein
MHTADFIHSPSGHFSLQIWRNDELLREIDEANLVVSGYREISAKLLGGENIAITRIGFGTSGVVARTSDTGLEAPFLLPVNTITYPATNRVSFNFLLKSAEGNGMIIREFGLMTGSGGLFARKVISPAVIKTSEIALTGTWTIRYL